MHTVETALEKRVFTKLLLFIMPAVLIAFMDRINISFAAGQSAKPPTPRSETLETEDGTRTAGLLAGDATSGFRFVGKATNKPVPLATGMTVHFGGRGTAPASGLPPFRIDLGLGQRISGRLVGVNEREIRLLEQAMKTTNAKTIVEGYDQDDAALGELQ